MKKSLSTLVLASMFAIGGVAQAETFDSPQQAGEASTMTTGAPNQLTTNSPYSDHSHSVVIDTTVMGAPPVVGSSIGAPDADVTYVFRPDVASRHQAASTFNVPSRAGEASTMTGGAPNMVTDNDRVIQQNGYPVIVQ